MKKIHKLDITNILQIGMKWCLKGNFRQILKIDWQKDKLMAWIEIDEDLSRIEYTLSAIPTGLNFEEREVGKYIDTIFEGPYVWHIYCKQRLIDAPWD